jgi:23S rRNA (adenine2503-C2)-methyltransferase
MKITNLTGLDISELEQFAQEIGEKPFRGRQLFSWIYAKQARDFEVMTDLAKPLRTKLSEVAEIGTVKVMTSILSKTSKTRKFLFQLSDREQIESVYIPEGKRRTLCISSQVGCALDCAFCATGSMGFKRNLTVGEIVDQVLFVEHEWGVKLSNIVMMGMGEPFLNYDNVIKSCQLISHDQGIAIGHRRIVVSTVGWVPGIVRFTEEGQKFRLAISLNAPSDTLRRELMPVAQKYRLGELMNAIKYYSNKSRLRPTIEYVLLAGVNDSQHYARQLQRLLRDIPCKVNLIPYNPVDKKYDRPANEHIAQFAEWLYPLSAPVIIRWSKGDDIRGACGQLAGHKGLVDQ